MKRDEILIAIAEAERFIAKAKLALKRREKDWNEDKARLGLSDRLKNAWDSQSKENATCKRASLDLSRVLADLRRGK